MMRLNRMMSLLPLSYRFIRGAAFAPISRSMSFTHTIQNAKLYLTESTVGSALYMSDDRFINPTKFVGSDMTITEYPNPVLRTKAADITDFDEKLNSLCEEMMSIMYQADGVGLAAPQVDLGIQLFVYNPLGEKLRKSQERIVCNPKILEYSAETDVEEEGCLSSRSGYCAGMVRRSKEIFVEYTDVKGQKTRRRLKGFEARVFQHEYDHTQGVLHLDRFSEEDRDYIQPELDKLTADYGATDGILELAESVRNALQPPTLRSEQPQISMLDSLTGNTEKEPAGFGGFGGGKGKKKKKVKKKK
mmetsp:Transcript_57119/g.66754  ORF Transcript_57119/g.66754 Transcript_57119/m.66754 type:complete len:303 (+) Transcript_57119:33-941(+)